MVCKASTFDTHVANANCCLEKASCLQKCDCLSPNKNFLGIDRSAGKEIGSLLAVYLHAAMPYLFIFELHKKRNKQI